MCFSQQISFVLSIVSILSTAMGIYVGFDIYSIIPYIIYSIMEITQYLQYRVINDCKNKWNVRLTYFTWILQWIQPLMWNFVWYSTTTENKEVFKFTMLFSIVIFVLGMVRMVYSLEPKFVKRPELQSSERTCTLYGMNHLKWKNKTGHFKGLEPNWFSYLIMWFLPLLWLRPIRSSLMYLFSFSFGIFVSLYMSNFALTDEFPSVWCLFSIPLLISYYVIHFFKSML